MHRLGGTLCLVSGSTQHQRKVQVLAGFAASRSFAKRQGGTKGWCWQGSWCEGCRAGRIDCGGRRRGCVLAVGGAMRLAWLFTVCLGSTNARTQSAGLVCCALSAWPSWTACMCASAHATMQRGQSLLYSEHALQRTKEQHHHKQASKPGTHCALCSRPPEEKTEHNVCQACWLACGGAAPLLPSWHTRARIN